ncbi:probable polygalacturonase [Cucurbita moschata]|uniref:Probable polygalacturonase n=1 Tax=Cucurbita moschata TaxID=3662 RepID=A0A6J1E2N3_CUCMO|nr:probable polygalacturonase [Cucurbita moschata]
MKQEGVKLESQENSPNDVIEEARETPGTVSEEPDVEQVTLEQVLRRSFKGYRSENLAVIVLVLVSLATVDTMNPRLSSKSLEFQAINCRKHSALLTEFGGVGDGVTSNTHAFQKVIEHLSTMAADGGAQLVMSPKKWVTGCFNLTSHFTLFIDKEVKLLAFQPIVINQNGHLWKFSHPMGGEEMLWVDGNNGIIDEQGSSWWKKFKKGARKVTRPYVIEIIFLFQHSIKDCYIVSNDDCIAIKSEYGIKFEMPIEDLVIRCLTCISPDSAGIALGSEMFGGIRNVRIENVTAINTHSAVRIKIARGRGGFVKDIFVRRMFLSTTKYVF